MPFEKNLQMDISPVASQELLDISKSFKCNKALPCHILHNAAGHAANRFTEEISFDIEDHSVDLYYWFDKSSKRKGALAEYYQFCDQSYAE